MDNETIDSKRNNTDYSLDISDDNIQDEKSIKIKNNKLISIGFCSKFYFYILGSALFKFISLFILGDKDNNIGLFGFAPILSSYTSVQSIFIYLGYIIIGIIFYFRKKKEKKENNILFLEALSSLYNKIINQDKNKTYFQIFFVCFGFAIYEIQNLFYILGYEPLDYWTFEIIFTFIFMKKYFEIDIYIHHKCSIISIFIITTALLFIASFFPCSSEGTQYESVEKRTGNYFYSILFILAFMCLSFIYSFSRNFSKVLMQAKSVLPDILIIFIGVIGLILTIVISIILYSLEKEDNFISYIKELKMHTTWEIIRDLAICSPIFLFFRFMQIKFEILIIYYLNPMYCLLLNNICYSIQKLIIYLFNIKKELFVYFILTEIAEVIAIFGYIIYLEIIELNFCGLSDNLKRKIMVKAEKDFDKLNNDKIGNLLKNDDDNEEDEGDSYIGLRKYEEMVEKRKNNKIN